MNYSASIPQTGTSASTVVPRWRATFNAISSDAPRLQLTSALIVLWSTLSCLAMWVRLRPSVRGFRPGSSVTLFVLMEVILTPFWLVVNMLLTTSLIKSARFIFLAILPLMQAMGNVISHMPGVEWSLSFRLVLLY